MAHLRQNKLYEGLFFYMIFMLLTIPKNVSLITYYSSTNNFDCKIVESKTNLLDSRIEAKVLVLKDTEPINIYESCKDSEHCNELLQEYYKIGTIAECTKRPVNFLLNDKYSFTRSNIKWSHWDTIRFWSTTVYGIMLTTLAYKSYKKN